MVVIPDRQRQSSGLSDVLIWAAVVAAVAVILTLAPALAGLGVFFFLTRRRLRIRDHAIILAATVFVSAAAPRAVFVEPVLWTLSVPGWVEGSLWPPPLPGWVVLGALYHSLAGVLWGLAARFGILARPALDDESSVLPPVEVRQSAAVVSPPGGVVGEEGLPSVVSGVRFGERRLSFGVGRRYEPVWLSEEELTRYGHGVILGSTGSGKTETIKALVACLLDLGYSGMIVDLKEDIGTNGLRDFLEVYCESHAIPFQEMALSDPDPKYWFDPLDKLAPDEARDLILSLVKFDDAHWQALNRKMLSQAVTLLYDAHRLAPSEVPYPTLYEIGRILSEQNIPHATKKLRGIVATYGPPGSIDPEERYGGLMHPTESEAQAAPGFGAKLIQLYSTEAGRNVLRPDPKGRRTKIDITADGLTYVGLDSSGRQDLAVAVSSAVLKQVAVWAAKRTTGQMAKDKPRFVIVDEANIVARPIVKEILARARSAGIMLVLCTQGPEDWIDQNGDDWGAMINNVNWGLVMSQMSQKSAELCAEFIGMASRPQVSQTVDPLGQELRSSTIREVVDYLVQPHDIRSLGVGEAILKVSRPANRVEWIRVVMRDPRAVVNPG